MSNKYENGKIYQITDTGYNKCYIGSTVEPLANRFSKHRYEYNNLPNKGLTSFLIFKEFGIQNCKIELIETFPCNNREELNAREGYHIRNTTCVNKQVAGRSDEQYRMEHKEQTREYRQNNKARINELKIKYYHKYSEVLKQPILCECGCYITKQCLGKHRKTNSHKQLVLNLNQSEVFSQT